MECVSGCCLTPIENFVIYVMPRTDEILMMMMMMMMMSALYQTSTFS